MNLNVSDKARAGLDHLAAHWTIYTALFTAAHLDGPLLVQLGDSFPNPVKTIACIVLSWVPWALILAFGWAALQFAGRVMNSRAGGDIVGLVITLFFAIIVATYAIDPTKLQSVVTALGGSEMHFGTCPLT